MKKLISGTWTNDKYGIYERNAPIFENTTSLAIYSDGSNLTNYSFEGQCSQASTPTPTVPVEVQEFGDLIPSFEPLNGIGEYKDTLDLSTGVVTRRIGKLVLDGTESWEESTTSGVNFFYTRNIENHVYIRQGCCTHLVCNLPQYANCYLINQYHNLTVNNCGYSTIEDFATFLAAQYANGTPVTIWYALATPTTETISLPNGMTGIIEGFTIQSGTPTPANPIMPTNNDVGGKTIIQITSAGQTQNIILSEPLRKIGNYADSVDSEGVVTRKIKKLILDGTEDWQKWGDSYIVNISSNYQLGTAALSTHYAWNATTPLANERFTIVNEKVWIRDDSQSTLTDFTTFLAQQYTNGTPVTVYYVLATPTIESVTVPTIPTSSGFSNIEISTSLAPSKVELDMGKMFVPKAEKVRVSGEWV